MGVCIRKRVVYDMSCKRFQFFVNVEALHQNDQNSPTISYEMTMLSYDCFKLDFSSFIVAISSIGNAKLWCYIFLQKLCLLFEALRSGQQIFSHFGRLPGFNQY